MKSQLLQVRVEPAVKRHLELAARFDAKSLSGLLVHAALVYTDTLRARGWRAKAAPAPRDHRRRVAA